MAKSAPGHRLPPAATPARAIAPARLPRHLIRAAVQPVSRRERSFWLPRFDADRVAARGAPVACRYRRQRAFLHVALGDIVLRCLPSAVTMRRKSLRCPACHFGVIMANAPRNRRPRLRLRPGCAAVI